MITLIGYVCKFCKKLSSIILITKNIFYKKKILLAQMVEQLPSK